MTCDEAGAGYDHGMAQRTRLNAAVIVLALSVMPGLAQDQATPPAGEAPTTTGTEATTLACTNSGSRYKVGEFACIAACHQQRRLARCDAIAEKASWTYVSESCPTAMINAPWPSDWTEVPVVTAMSVKPLVVNLTAIPANDRLAFAAFSGAGTITR